MIKLINIESVPSKYVEGALIKKGTEYHYLTNIKIENRKEDEVFVVRLMPFPQDISTKEENDIRYKIGAYKFTLKKPGSQTIKSKQEMTTDEYGDIPCLIISEFLSFLSKNYSNNVIFDYGIFELYSKYNKDNNIEIEDNFQTTTVFNEFTVTVNIKNIRHEDWKVISKSNFKIVPILH